MTSVTCAWGPLPTLTVTVSAVLVLSLRLPLNQRPTWRQVHREFSLAVYFPLCNVVYPTNCIPVSVREMLKMTSLLRCKVFTSPVWPALSPLRPSILLEQFDLCLVVSALLKVRISSVYCAYRVLVSKLGVDVRSNTRVSFSPAHIQFTPPTKSVNPDPLLAAYTVLNLAASQITSAGSQCYVSRGGRLADS